MMASKKQSIYLFIIFSFLFLHPAWSQHDGHDHAGHIHHKNKGIEFIKNNNQLHENVLYEAPINGANRLFLEQKALTYLFLDDEDVHAIHDIKHEGSKEDLHNHIIKGHSYKVRFKDALEAEVSGHSERKHYYNYFRGNDSSKWAGNVPVFGEVYYKGLYDRIDLAAYSAEEHFKYDFIIRKGGNPAQIQLEYEGMDRLSVKHGHLLIQTSVGTTRESKPYAYQIINGRQKAVKCGYQLSGNTVSFHFPNGYDPDYEVVIDPEVVAATLSGTQVSENFGHTATFDNEGNIYAGGISFGSGYPVTPGAFQQNFAGGSDWILDMAVSKYNPDGSDLIYATYIGGSGDDSPHSMIVDFNNQLCILGTTVSGNFPVLPNSYQNTKSGAEDIVVVKLNAAGSALVGSTFMGGSQSDGINQSSLNTSYGEVNRGEIVLDGQGNIYIASVSSSSNFPTTQNAFQENKNSLQDGVVFKMNSDLSTLFWSTFLGSAGNDTAGGLKVDDNGNLVVVGTAGGADFPMVAGGYQPAWPGGQESTYIASISTNGQQMVRGTYWGTANGNDHGYFVDIDEDNHIHILGTTTGSGLPHTPGAYTNNQDSPQYLAAFNSQLNGLIYATTIGLGTYGGSYDFVPIAFMVDKCNHIYFSGYYARSGLPLTPDAISGIGNSFYLGVLEPEAAALSFGTFYGKADHVDGGTSRFDKSGIVYQAVCSCDANVLNTTTNAWAANQAARCDIGVFKIDFERETVTSAFTAVPSSSGCAPYTADFNYTGQDGETFVWELDGNVIANSENTSYTFNTPGNYNVMLIASAGNTCNVVDTSFLQIDVLAGTSTLSALSFCPGEDFLFLDASTVNATYSWQDGTSTATYSVSEPGIYWVDILLPGCSQRDSFDVYVSTGISVELEPDQSVCDMPSFDLNAFDAYAVSYEWSSGETTPSITATGTGNYMVTLTDQYGCSITDNINLVFAETPVFSFTDTLVCEGENVVLQPNINADYLWSDGSTNTSLTINQAGEYSLTLNNGGCMHSASMQLDLSYIPISQTVTGIACVDDCNGAIETVVMDGEDVADLVLEWNIGGADLVLDDLCEGNYDLTVTDEYNCEFIFPNELIAPLAIEYEIAVGDVVCPGDDNGFIEIINVSGGTPPYGFTWNGELPTTNNALEHLAGGTNNVLISDANGCTYEEDVFVYEPLQNFVDAGPDLTIELGDSVRINGFVLITNNQDISWAAADGIWCTSCIRPVASPVNTTTYTITVVDGLSGCVLSDEMTVFLEKPRNVFIPNAFSPNEDGHNDRITIYAGRGTKLVKSFSLFNRWGELVFADANFPPNSDEFGWDGIFNGKKMNAAVFVYIAEVEFLDGEVKFYKGDVTLVD